MRVLPPNEEAGMRVLPVARNKQGGVFYLLKNKQGCVFYLRMLTRRVLLRAKPAFSELY
ncbi:MAG: hypothetical protein ACPGWR_25805 [Ardenticatenaceae bacterium]